MSLVIKSKHETVKIAGATFTYKQIPFVEKKRIIFKHMKNGKLANEDSLDMGYNFMEQIIIGWEDVVDEDGNQVPFDATIIKHFPVDMALEFMDAIILPSLQDIIGTAKNLKNQQAKELENLE